MEHQQDATADAAAVPGRYWHRLEEDGRLQCDLCPRCCRLHEGQRGLCFVRARQGDRLMLTTYARSSGFCIALTAWSLTAEGRCAACGTPGPDVFNARPGNRGRRRARVAVPEPVRA